MVKTKNRVQLRSISELPDLDLDLNLSLTIQDTIECQCQIIALLFVLNTFLFLISRCVLWVEHICLMTINDDLMILKMKVVSVMSWTAVLYLL